MNYNKYSQAVNKDINIEECLTYTEANLNKTKSYKLLRGANYILRLAKQSELAGSCFCTKDERVFMRNEFYRVYDLYKNLLPV